MEKKDEKEYELALRTQLAERRALWEILQEIIGRYASISGDPGSVIENMNSRIIFRLDQKDSDATKKGLELPLATVKASVDRFFSELSLRLEQGSL